MLSSPDEIKSALDAYRAHVASRNRKILEVYVPFIASAEPDEDADAGADDVEQLRMSSLRELVCADEEDFEELGIAAPGDVLERYDALAERLGLDGVTVSRGLAGERRQEWWDEYFDAVLSALKTKCREEVRGTIEIPAEVRTLAGFVDSVDEPGLPKDYASFLFWGLRDRIQGWGDHGRKAAETVRKSEEIMSGLDRTWEVAGGWELGDGGEEGTFCAVYCRREREEDEDEEEWEWRYTYVTHCDFSSWVFDTIPQILEWYREFRDDEDPPKVDDLDATDVLYGIF
ncbi:hypothetical protein CkaCkLH20_08523 [Colletotrichum karsti]|uniref:Uncharacterized protein n=1 Tax=Colletotrichum karsti TaxID=1095194 RepID=A0A9P6I398_9PEZI|nr:uncharacterized protein CkaCkLH20_08523 [Colletotrichum karsti]KAF9874151.1 hypothetical protein CkaCkLH20_08523 [Colletotrichum karsti]